MPPTYASSGAAAVYWVSSANCTMLEESSIIAKQIVVCINFPLHLASPHGSQHLNDLKMIDLKVHTCCRQDPLIALASGVSCDAMAEDGQAWGGACVIRGGLEGNGALRLRLPGSENINCVLALPGGYLAGLGEFAKHVVFTQ